MPLSPIPTGIPTGIISTVLCGCITGIVGRVRIRACITVELVAWIRLSGDGIHMIPLVAGAEIAEVKDHIAARNKENERE